jgi:MFS-type transporter involved in bile tolerance (Atg22 family)
MRTSILFLITFFVVGAIMLIMVQQKAREVKVLPAEAAE